MRTSALVVLAASWVLHGAACGKKDDKPNADKASAPAGKAGTVAGGCDRREKEHLCGEYHGAATSDWVKKECPNYGGAPYVEACPTEGAVARCVVEPGTTMEVHNVFYAPVTKEAADAMCKGTGMELRAP